MVGKQFFLSKKIVPPSIIKRTIHRIEFHVQQFCAESLHVHFCSLLYNSEKKIFLKNAHQNVSLPTPIHLLTPENFTNPNMMSKFECSSTSVPKKSPYDNDNTIYL